MIDVILFFETIKIYQEKNKKIIGMKIGLKSVLKLKDIIRNPNLPVSNTGMKYQASKLPNLSKQE